jgi:hypothetical protein
MRTLLTTVALSVALATPALSATTRHHARTYDSRAYNSFAAARDRDLRPNSIIRRDDVYSSHGYVGSDPDPRVRDQLRHDPTQGVD